MKQYFVDAFTNEPFTGNPAAVCVMDNWPSRKTLEYLKGELLEIAELPEDNDMRVNDGDTEKCIFRFDL